MRDPVARSIRNQQMQDAVPSPEERERQRRKYLQDNGCRFCGEDDPDKLEGVQVLLGNCMGGDSCDVVYCDDCGFDSDFFERWLKIKGKRRTNDVIVIYDCGESRGYETPEPRTEMVEVCVLVTMTMGTRCTKNVSKKSTHRHHQPRISLHGVRSVKLTSIPPFGLIDNPTAVFINL